MTKKPKGGLKPAAKKTKSPKKSKKSKTLPPPLLSPLSGDLSCSCGCGQVADCTDWDTQKPLSWNCLLSRAAAAEK